MNTQLKQAGLLILTAAACWSCSTQAEHKPEAKASADPVVETTQVLSLQPSLQTVLPGELKPWNKVTIYPRVKGYVGRVAADRGTVVKQGAILAVLDAPEVASELNRARAQVASSEAILIEQRAKSAISKNTYSRIVDTHKTPGAVSANELDVARSRMLTDSALMVAAQENLGAAKATFATQQQLVSYLTIVAPFDGIIIERNVSPGELVGPDGNAKAMFVLEDQSKLRLTIGIPENLSNSLPEKSNVFFTVQADPLKEYKAHFSRSANSLQENNRTMITEFDVDNRGGELKAGMYAEVHLPIGREAATMFVPRTALIHSTEGVFVVRVHEEIAEWVRIKKGNPADSVEIFGKIQPGEEVVKYAFEELRNGQKVEKTASKQVK